MLKPSSGNTVQVLLMAGLLLVFAPFAAGDMAISVNQEAVQAGVPDAVGVPDGDDIQITVDLTEPEKSEVEQIVVTGEFLVDVRDGLSGMAVYQDPPGDETPPSYDRYSIRWAAAERQVPCFTSLDTARAAVESLLMERSNYSVLSTGEYLNGT